MPKPKISYLTVRQVEAFMHRVRDRQDECGGKYDSIKWRTIFALIYRYGLRSSEAAMLTVGSLNLDHKGEYLIHINRVKRGVSETYPLFQDVAELIRAWLPRRLAFYTPHNTPDSPLFLNRQRDTLSAQGIQKQFRQIAGEIGLPNQSVHCLRHSIAIHAIQNDIPVIKVQYLLGHRSIMSTMEYAKLLDKGKKDLFDNIQSKTQEGKFALI